MASSHACSRTLSGCSSPIRAIRSGLSGCPASRGLTPKGAKAARAVSHSSSVSAFRPTKGAKASVATSNLLGGSSPPASPPAWYPFRSSMRFTPAM